MWCICAWRIQWVTSSIHVSRTRRVIYIIHVHLHNSCACYEPYYTHLSYASFIRVSRTRLDESSTQWLIGAKEPYPSDSSVQKSGGKKNWKKESVKKRETRLHKRAIESDSLSKCGHVIFVRQCLPASIYMDVCVYKLRKRATWSDSCQKDDSVTGKSRWCVLNIWIFQRQKLFLSQNRTGVWCVTSYSLR